MFTLRRVNCVWYVAQRSWANSWSATTVGWVLGVAQVPQVQWTTVHAMELHWSLWACVRRALESVRTQMKAKYRTLDSTARDLWSSAGVAWIRWWSLASMVRDLCCDRLIILLSTIMIQLVYYYNLLFLTPTVPIPFHTSILTGKAWVLELLNGHPDWMQISLGVSVEVFQQLVNMLTQCCGFTCSRNGIYVEEQLAIFLYTAVMGLSSWHVGECFKHSNETIVRWGFSW